jgi:hypothetical protein
VASQWIRRTPSDCMNHFEYETLKKDFKI